MSRNAKGVHMRKRNHIIPLHLNKKELAHLEAQVKLSGLAREEFLRSLIMGAQLQARPCTHHADQADNFHFVYAQMKNLRRKLIDAGANIEIKAIYGFGYKLVPPIE